ncbi:hypothetical protein AXE80_02895 [Wenyingzhuangia fucanilytica]|uniref:Lambda-carrageenase n=1 Tax=Wenyingzhuangia fucanilytica TaxID=1790137 RepID=A0A1B1Y3E2_9FLAO|nr:hypothetical protein [Wenyingzhuangia fucanilytica]ANW95296.1 hypothetical protein AXE80_02895 [Wenyingzhuangia fucanilytica]
MKNNFTLHPIVFLLAIFFEITAQGSLPLNKNYYGFESAESGWSSENAENWSFTNEKASPGTYSLKYSLSNTFKDSGLYSIETGHTISKVRSSVSSLGAYIVASSYEGIVLGVGYDGTILWENKLSGFMNHDLWCEDINDDGVDEIFAANANGTLYCLNSLGKILWEFKVNDAPMYGVCVVKKDDIPYVVCGGYDKNVYYLSADGTLKQTLEASTYSKNKTWGDVTAPSNTHVTNFLRKLKKADGTDMLAISGANNNIQISGYMYFFEVLGESPTSFAKINIAKPIGDMRIVDIDGAQKVIMGTSGHIGSTRFVQMNPFDVSEPQAIMDINTIKSKVGNFSYSVVQPEVIPDGSSYKYFLLHGPNIILVAPDMDLSKAEVITSNFAFNDMWKEPVNNKIILASAQSGGSAIHVINTNNPGWKDAFKNLSPPGKIKAILNNTTKLTANLANFTKPSWERNPHDIYLLYENFKNINTSVYNAPKFIPQNWFTTVQDGATWNRDAMENDRYRDKRDKRKKYILTEDQVVSNMQSNFDENGISYWGGHGNDPYYYSLETTKKVIDFAAGRKTALIYPELEDHTDDFQFVMDDLFYPLATYGDNKNLSLFIRSKNIFWQGNAYLPQWSRLLSGEFAHVFVPSMEETSDKTMDLSLSGRMGVWASGAVDSWGSRAVPDNMSYDRLRQYSYQQLDNAFLRQLVYAAASGAQYFDNFVKPVLFEQLLAKGALFVPKRSEIVSFSPVHLSMVNPDTHYLKEGTDTKWLTKFDQDYEDNNPFVFSRMNGSWPGAPTNSWDFSNYAACVKERRLNFLPSYENGMVLITPPQTGIYADTGAIRAPLKDNLHPLYNTIMKEHFTDGRYYYSSTGAQFSADQYHKTIKADIEDGATKIPLTVTGGVAWVVAQTSPTHLRLTIIDGGYINPSRKIAKVRFNTVRPSKMTDLLEGKIFSVSNSSEIEIDIPCGLFRFIDIELTAPLSN